MKFKNDNLLLRFWNADWSAVFMSRLFVRVLLSAFAALVGGAVLLFAALIVGMMRPIESESLTLPLPQDVCAGHVIHQQMAGWRAFVDYVDLNGNTVYLVYKVSSISAPELQSKQVIAGDDCRE